MMLGRSAALVYGAPPRVNLLPPAERERREQAALARRWGLIAVGAAALVVLAVAVTALLVRSADGDLQAEQARTTALARQLAANRDVATATRDKSAYEAYRTQVMTSDVSWGRALGALQDALPNGARIDGFDAVVGAAASAAATSATGGGATLAATAPSGTVATFTVQVSSMLPMDQKAVVASFTRVPGVLGVEMADLSSESSASYSSTTTVFFDDSILSHKYAEKAG
ncbi:hypothetical protein [Nocardioides sp. Kera G14]|uniref:hypothetical protein n=1 Tax=Nocardioides sp. Kera G14 TaxID=2884264 RepID=UPI001D11D940|nr:hypothetical protein [Nocardioides sp. Kera G14]UDY23073.1 hypothetical protein LH076_13525 [Nocardioides sp. Kera G14]